jgi:hypothetical protein
VFAWHGSCTRAVRDHEPKHRLLLLAADRLVVAGRLAVTG